MPVSRKAHQSQLFATPRSRTKFVTRLGVSVLNVVATIDTPTSHHGAARPEVKNSAVLVPARLARRSAGRNDIAIERLTMPHRIRRELRLLRAHALITTPLLIVVLLTGFLQIPQRMRFTEIDVERINIVEPDGKLRMVISNRPRSIGPIYKGKPFGYPGGTRPGIIFFNDEETENGGRP